MLEEPNNPDNYKVTIPILIRGLIQVTLAILLGGLILGFL